MSKICEGRVVIVTGAGGGIGRAHALESSAAPTRWSSPARARRSS